MKTIKHLFIPFLLLFVMTAFLSCEKESVADIDTQREELQDLMSQLKDPANRTIFFEAINKALTQNSEAEGGQAKSAEFTDPVPIWLSGGFLLSCNGQIVSFDAPFDNNDFYRENPDGTVSVQHTSKEAYFSYLNTETGEEYEGENGNMHVKYTGTYFELYIPAIGVTIRTILTNDSPNARILQGTGKIVTETGAEKTLIAHLSDAPGDAKNGCIRLE
ncbi:hypothetical protein [Flavilitoribacter nigricans]|uniref:Uncharacterized protein n=1 Tax=Flavilitoribacter nigricans (strain ATCC 23147 / DSM 23189 / NBRC 102662 / NCIMB 1420 / SS-2) TaxID=1122177 RepID=A0A2D0N2R3_FLAN2|nr:hypothetical protein [Flavilitoribacter nigricans]PHN02700.1 hypothetical protein CRP01_30420 [Flavilitoribacter nigricans DSM 23189 = NBRC 102662]